ncbi:type VI secretion system needle protein Hcp, partial [Bacteroides ovatus]
TFYVTYPHLPNRDMIQWMLDARKYQSGAIVVHDNQGSTLEKILFEKATCVDMEISYIRQGKSYIATKLTVQAQKLAFGTEEFENQWVF